jgi:2-keto-4-pentenoate hydratase/2-oxohepta-3-ene-1,7-dioic acid hydratase in catechol pathway
MTIDLESQEIVRAGGQTVRFDVAVACSGPLAAEQRRDRFNHAKCRRDRVRRDKAQGHAAFALRTPAAGNAMRLGTYAKAGEREWRAALFHTDDEIVDLADALAASADGRALAAEVPNPTDILSWITPEGQAVAARIAKALAADQLDVARIRLATVRHGPPVPNPGKFIAIGRNYMNHVREGQRIWAARGKVVEVPTFPAAFAKFASAITAHGTPIVVPDDVLDVDYELELAFVIGRPAYRVPVEQALQYVAGYTICNDVGARQIQRKEMESQIGLTCRRTFRRLRHWVPGS